MPSRPIEKTCEWCDQSWTTRKHGARTCSAACRARLRESEKPSAGRPQREYPPEIVDLARSLYESGGTVREVADAIGPGYRAQEKPTVDLIVTMTNHIGELSRLQDRLDNVLDYYGLDEPTADQVYDAWERDNRTSARAAAPDTGQLDPEQGGER